MDQTSFDQQANAPLTWELIGESLVITSRLLAPTALSQSRLAEDEVLALRVLPSFLMLHACAVECLLKAAYIKTVGPVAKSGRIKVKEFLTHDLLVLGRRLLPEITPPEERALEKLRVFSELGRFPVAKHWQQHQDRTGAPPDILWTEADEQVFAVLLRKLGALVKGPRSNAIA